MLRVGQGRGTHTAHTFSADIVPFASCDCRALCQRREQRPRACRVPKPPTSAAYSKLSPSPPPQLCLLLRDTLCFCECFWNEVTDREENRA